MDIEPSERLLAQRLQQGILLFQSNRLEEAEAVFRGILVLTPDHVVALDMLACIAHRTARYGQALSWFHYALHSAPNDAFVHFNLATALEEQGRQQEAAAAYRTVLALKPDHLKAGNRLGRVLLAMGDAAAAAEQYRQTLCQHPDRPVLHHNLGVALHRLGKPGTAESCLRRALQLAPDYGDALYHLGTVLRERGRLDEALRCLRRAAVLSPGDARIHTALGAVCESLDRYQEALATFSRALQAAPGDPAIQWRLALLLLLHGELPRGFAEYESRFKGAEDYRLALGHDLMEKLAGKPRWQGEPLRGLRLLVWTEQGLGDAVMMMRYLPLLRARGAGDILVACQPALVTTFETLPVVRRAIAHGLPFSLEEFDLQCSMMSLPHLCGTRSDNLPRDVPYVTVPPHIGSRWRKRLEPIAGCKVGLAWAGSGAHRKDALRSLPFDCLAPLLALPGVTFFSLQKDRGAEHPALADLMMECGDFLDTAGLIQQLDLIISVDTAMAHLAGALARPVWLLNRYESEWRWMLKRMDSPWYPTMRIFRQPAPGAWDRVVEQVTAALQKGFVHPSAPSGSYDEKAGVTAGHA